MNIFQYHPDILARYPAVTGGAMLAQGMSNGPTPDSLHVAFQAEQRATLQRIGDTPLSQIESLAAWRNAFRGFDVDRTQYRSAAEALLRPLTTTAYTASIKRLV